jgi:hypothetical protein
MKDRRYKVKETRFIIRGSSIMNHSCSKAITSQLPAKIIYSLPLSRQIDLASTVIMRISRNSLQVEV